MPGEVLLRHQHAGGVFLVHPNRVELLGDLVERQRATAEPLGDHRHAGDDSAAFWFVVSGTRRTRARSIRCPRARRSARPAQREMGPDRRWATRPAFRWRLAGIACRGGRVAVCASHLSNGTSL